MSILNETYMLTRENMLNHISYNLKNTKVDVDTKVNTKINTKIISKNKMNDILFWTI